MLNELNDKSEFDGNGFKGLKEQKGSNEVAKRLEGVKHRDHSCGLNECISCDAIRSWMLCLS